MIEIFNFENRRMIKIEQQEKVMYRTDEDITCSVCKKRFLVQVNDSGFLYCPYCQLDLGICAC